ncbi:flagellar biosynthetic protein FliP [Effusibacillus dendaii]|uniref:Flagellar biosynthetic protein FliP n=2 Tax=Effusibacillus dendaii TaxID=2743772 RepID=A0A7I8D590_9BACL|nr:flagellar type III secretion system pore protein FliP [Effusibacillus dendaii]BCJ85274.1 flagellar biosynthetic protein FliP [Effusibacillus dendaii]
MKLKLLLILTVLIGSVLYGTTANAEQVVIPGIDLNVSSSQSPQNVATSVQIILMLTVLSLAPSILILMTCFTRIIVVFSFARNALSIQQMPPNQVLIGLALFMTLFVMTPTLSQVNQKAVQPYLAGQLTQTEALNQAAIPFKQFMAKQTREKDLMLFIEYRKDPVPKTIEEIPLTTLVPAYAISELKTAFQIGFMLFIPFLIIDLVVSTTLMSMGMMMLPPVMISLPFKILLFVMVDGWYLIVKSLLQGYQ